MGEEQPEEEEEEPEEEEAEAKKNPNETNSRTIEHFNVMVDYKSDGVGGRATVPTCPRSDTM